jgi:terminal uridylyltransferase
MRAARILAIRPERAIVALAQLCEERKEEEVSSPPPPIFVPPRLSPLPPQTPYTVGSSPIRSKGSAAPERLSPKPQFFEPGPRVLGAQQVPSRSPPEHMAPKRGKWTSPPPPEAPEDAHSMFDDQLGLGLELATSSTGARERDDSCASSSSNSEIFSDEDRCSDVTGSDDVQSVRSFTEGSSPSQSFRRTIWLSTEDLTARLPAPPSAMTTDALAKAHQSARGRLSSRIREKHIDILAHTRAHHGSSPTICRTDSSRRSSSGPARTSSGLPWSPNTPIALVTPLPPSPVTSNHHYADSTIFYETTGAKFSVLYPTPGSHSSIFPRYQQPQHHKSSSRLSSRESSPIDYQASLVSLRALQLAEAAADRATTGHNTPTPGSFSHSHPSHSHSHSAATIHAPTPPPNASKFCQSVISSSHLISRSRPQSSSPPNISTEEMVPRTDGSVSPRCTSNGSDSPTTSSTGYATSLSRSPSPSPPIPSMSPFSPLSKPDAFGQLPALSPYSCSHVSLPLESPPIPGTVSLNDFEPTDSHHHESVQGLPLAER